MQRFLGHLIYITAPDHRKDWARAMQAEIVAINASGAAFAYAIGCLIACYRFHLELQFSPHTIWSATMKDSFTISAIFAGIVACLIGLTYLRFAGAPDTMLAVNSAALILGILLAAAIRFTVKITDRFLTGLAVLGALILLGTSLFGFAIEDARRWILIGPFFIQTSLILLPVIMISFAKTQNTAASLAVIISAIAMAIQPDRALAGMLCAAVFGVCWLKPSLKTKFLSVIGAAAFAITLIQPDNLPAVPYVDHILWSAFDTNPLIGASLWFGSFLLISPLIFVPKSQRTQSHFAFTLCWFALVIAAAMGAYPTPILGYGASAIIGYFLSLALVTPREQVRTANSHAPKKLNTPDEASSFNDQVQMAG